MSIDHGITIPMSTEELGRLDRLVLKAAFRSIGQLLQEIEKLAWQGAA